MKDISAFGNTTLTNLFINEFIKGHQKNLTEVEEKIVNQIKDGLDLQFYENFVTHSGQYCNNLYSSISFRGKNLTWKSINGRLGPGPSQYSTDFGSCCYFVPHWGMDPINTSISVAENIHSVKGAVHKRRRNFFVCF